MFRSRARKIFRDVWGRKGRTALATTAIFIGVFGVVALMSMGDLLTQQLLEDNRAEDIAMQEVTVALPSAAVADNASLIAALEVLPGVESVEGRVFTPLFWKKPGEAKLSDGWLNATWEPFDQLRIEPMRLVEGRYPFVGQKEVAVERRMADAQGLEVGDQLILGAFGEEGFREETWEIVGLVFNPYLVGFPGFDPTETAVFMPYEDTGQIRGAPSLSTLVARYVDFNTAEQQADAFVAAIGQNSAYFAVSSFTSDPEQEIEASQQTSSLLGALGLLAAIVSGFLVANIINTIVVEQRQQIGVMKSLGATRSDNLLMYIGVALSYGVLGMVPGVVLGVLVGAGMAVAIGPFFSAFVEGFNVSASGIVTGVVMGLVVPFVAALLPVLLGTRVTILEAMTDLGIAVDYGRGLLARVLRVVPLPINVRQALSNVTRKKGRLVLTWLTLTLAAGAFMGVLGSFLALDELIDNIFGTFSFQLSVSFEEHQDFDQMRALILDNVEGIKAVYPNVDVPIEVEGYVEPQSGSNSPATVGFDTQSDSVQLNLEAGTAWQADPDRQGVVLSSTLADRLEKELGDRFVFTSGGQTFEREIIGVANFAFDFVFMDWRDTSAIAEAVRGEPPPPGLMVQMTAEDPNVDDVDAVIDQIKEVMLANGINAGMFNQLAFAEGIATLMIAFSSVFIAAASVTAAVGAIGLLATLSMAVFERQREIGVMRSIGAGSATIAGQFLVEGNLIGLFAWLVGIPLAFLLSAVLVQLFPFEMEAGVPISSLAIGLFGMLIIATVSSLWPSINAARKTVSEIIRYQ